MQYVYNGDCSKIYEQSSIFVSEDGTQFGADWNKARIPGMQGVIETLPPDDNSLKIVGSSVEMVNDLPTRVWYTEAKSSADIIKEENDSVYLQIAALEQSVTPRRLRESVLSDQGKTWLESVDLAISTLRSSLK